jgi:cell wall-associated NlpC family hydrolase
MLQPAPSLGPPPNPPLRYMTRRSLSIEEDEIIRSNLHALQKQTRFKVPNIDVPIEIELPEIDAPSGMVSATGVASSAGGAVTGQAIGTSDDIPIPPSSAIGKAVTKAALNMRGIPYSWGGGGPSGPSRGFAQGANIVGFDCSSLMQYAFAKYGVNIPRVTYDQYRAGTPVPRSKMQPGDLMFFRASSRGPEHVGMYVGNGQFLHAPQTGDVIKLARVSDRSDLVGIRRYGVGAKAPAASKPAKNKRGRVRV